MKTKTVTINVTQRDIDKGCRGHGGNCPIALAIFRRLSKGVVSVGWERTRFELPKGLLIFSENPKTARQFVEEFDACNPVSPFRFDIDIPVSMLRAR